MAASASKLLENALNSIQGRERNSSKVVPKGIGPVLATKGLFAREGCTVKIRTGGMPCLVEEKKGQRRGRGEDDLRHMKA